MKIDVSIFYIRYDYEISMLWVSDPIILYACGAQFLNCVD